MTTYYKGTITSEIQNKKMILAQLDANGLIFKINDFNKYTKEEIQLMTNYIMKQRFPLSLFLIRIQNKKIIYLIEKILSTPFVTFKKEHVEIVYEIIKDTYGNYYGKEIITGKIFPIHCEKYIKTTYYCTKYRDYIELSLKRKHDIYTMDKAECVIVGSKVATNDEVDKYKRYNSIKKFTKKINKLFDKNIYKEEIKLEEHKTPIKKDMQNLKKEVINNILHLLSKLYQIDESLYIEYQTKYKNMISNENFIITELSSLEEEIKDELIFKPRSIYNTLDYFELLKIEYLTNNLNKENPTTSITLDDIDNFVELYTKTCDNYSKELNEKILKDIALIYLMEVYENIDCIPTYRLKESHFKNNLKYILLTIESLRTLGIIESNINVDLNNDITLENTLDIIRKIKFNDIKKESVNVLMKRI